MALTTGSGTFTNGSVTVSGVTFSSGGASFISSGTLLGVGVSPMDRQVEAVSATTNTITLREPWAGTTGAKEFTAAYTTEGLRDAVDSARGFSEQLASRSTATTTDMQNATDDVKISTPLKVKQAIDFHSYNKAAADAEFVSRSDIVGTVSQSGGVPTGAIIESGSNANGYYVKYADGTMICTSDLTVLGGTTVLDGILYRGSMFKTWLFPTAFTSSPSVSGFTGGAGFRWVVSTGTAASTSDYKFLLASSINSTADDVLRFSAVGRWF